MKKIYLLAIALLLGNITGFSATKPDQSAKKPASKNVQKNSDLSSENVINSSSLQTVTGARSISPSASVNRIPMQSNFSTAVGCIYSDDFDTINTVAGLQARGYLTYYRGTGPAGVAPIFFQGNPTVFSAFNGPANGYVGSNFNCVTLANNIDNWLILPVLSVDSGDAVSFYSRGPLGSIRPDSLHVWYSAAGATLPEDTTWVLLGEFLVNSAGDWEKNTFIIPDSSSTGRIAIRYAIVDGGPDGSNSNYTGIDQLEVYRPSATDGNLFEITAPITKCGLTATEPVTVVINNTGSVNLSGFNVSFALDTNAAVVETVTDTILPGGTLTYTFTSTADLSGLGTHTIVATVIDTADGNSCNDVQTITVTNTAIADPYTTAYTMGFEPSEDFSTWVIEDADGDGTTWAPVTTILHSGTTAMRRAGSGGTDDDWLFSSCLNLDSGLTYTLEYWYFNFDLANAALMEATLNTEQTSLSVVQLIAQQPVPTDSVNYQYALATFSVNSSGTYYIGFHAYNLTGTGTSSVRIDDINVDNGTHVGIRGNELTNKVNIYPNPNKGHFYISSQSKAKNVTVEVYNLSGQQVYFSRLDNLNQQMIDLSNQANGVYNIRVISDSYVENHSVVISR